MSLSGQATATSLDTANPTFDSSNSGPPPSIAPITFTFVTHSSLLSSVPTAVTIASPPGNASASAVGSNPAKVSTGVVVGIAVGVFAALAIALVIWMSVRHKRRMARRPRGSRKSWNKLDDSNGSDSARKGTIADVPMRTVEKHSASSRVPSVPFQNIKTQSHDKGIISASLASVPTIAEHPYSRNIRSGSDVQSSSTMQLAEHTLGPDSRMTTRPYHVQAPQASSQPKRPGHLGEDGNNIPNPFLSRSPSNSSTYHSIYHNAGADHDPSALSAFPAVQMALRLNSVASVSDYAEDKSPSPTQSHYPDISSTYLDVERQSPRKSYESSLYEQYGAGTLGELHPPTHLFSQPNPAAAPPPKSIQDIITALDGDKPHTAWKDSNNRGSSRLSLGEGLVDPSMTFDPARQSHTSNMTAQTDLDMDSFPLPPRNNATLNPFRDRQ